MAETRAPSPASPPASTRSSRTALYGVLACCLAGGGFLAYQYLGSDGKSKIVAAVSSDAGGKPATLNTAPIATDAQTADTATTPTVDASRTIASKSPSDAGAATITPPDVVDVDVIPSDSLVIDSKPQGAKVYLDGTLAGKTPITIEGSADQFRLALVLEGHVLHTDDINGNGKHMIELADVVPPDGPGGIKVRCKKKDRYYVFVDGEPIGQLCPTERVGVGRGAHDVEIYDPVTDSRRKFKVQVEDLRLSVRVRVD